MSLSDAERRRQERRQRILNNQGARLQKILGPNSNFTLPTNDDLGPSIDHAWEDEPITTRTSSKTVTKSLSESNENLEVFANNENVLGVGSKQASTTSSNYENPLLRSTSVPSSQNQRSSSSGDGITTSHEVQNEFKPKITMKQHHVFLFLLSLSLTIFGGNYFLLYLVIYEFTLVASNGFCLPLFYSSKNSFFTLFLLYGVPEVYRKTFQEAAILLNWFTTDLTIFISSALILPLFRYVTA